MSPNYQFRYKHGQSYPYANLAAANDVDFFDTVLPAWEKKTGFKHVEGSVICSVNEYRKVPEPAQADARPHHISPDVAYKHYRTLAAAEHLRDGTPITEP